MMQAGSVFVPLLGRFLGRLWSQSGTQLGTKLAPKSEKYGSQDTAKNNPEKVTRWAAAEPSWWHQKKGPGFQTSERE